MRHWIFYFTAAILLVLLAGIGAKKDDGLDINSSAIFKNNVALFNYVKKYSVAEALKRLSEIEKEAASAGSCHVIAHKVGIYAYEQYGPEAFGMCTELCGGGCYHGAIGEHTQKYGILDFKKTLSQICLESERYDQCLHGLGHGLIAWTDFELFQALNLCELVSDESYKQNECWRGVFMENILGTFQHTPGLVSKYLSDDPAFPCTIVPEKYKPACFQFETFRIGQLYGKDYKKASDVCASISEPYNRACFTGLGSNVFRDGKNLKKVISICNYISQSESRSLCLYGAIKQATFGQSKFAQQSICQEIKGKTDIIDYIYASACPAQ